MLAVLEMIDEENKRIFRNGEKSGIKKGRKEGKREGRIEGMKEKAKETAKKMLEENVDIGFIMRVTGLKKDEIESL